MRRWKCRNEAETRAVGRGLAAELLPHGVLLLCGDLGCGKTVLVRGLAEGLGIPPEAVQSPTFTLVRELEGPLGRLLHLDLYRLESREVEALGLDELMEQEAVKAVEWAERMPWVPHGTLALRLRRQPDGSRLIEEMEKSD